MDKKMIERLKFGLSPPVVMLIVAVLIAGIISYLSYGMLMNKKAAQNAQADTQQVAVAAFEIKWGTVVTKEQVQTQKYLKGSLPVGYIADPSKVVGRVVIYPMQFNEPFTEGKLAPVSVTTGGVAAIVTPNKRAMAVSVDKVVGVSGFILPGHRVDVLVTIPGTDKVLQPTTKIVLENLPVLAVGTRIEQSASEKEKSVPVDVITLEVTPEDGEKLALAASQGKLQLALRNYTDTGEVLTRGAVIPALLGSYVGGAASPEKATLQRAARKAPARVYKVSKRSIAGTSAVEVYTVDLIEGSKARKVNFSNGGE